MITMTCTIINHRLQFSSADAPCGDMLELRICFCFFTYMLELFA